MSEKQEAQLAMAGNSREELLNVAQNLHEFRTNATLRHEEWKYYDNSIIAAYQKRLVGVADLLSRGLVLRPPNGIASTVLQSQKISDMNDAELSMDGLTRTENDRQVYDSDYLPLPFIHKDYQINDRHLRSSRAGGGSALDATQAEVAARKVAERAETILFNGVSYTYGSGTIYGYLTAPNKNTYSITVKWDDSACDGEIILADVLAMKQLLIAKGYYGPFGMYIPTEYETALDEDFKSEGDKTVRERLMEITGLELVKTADVMTAGNVVMTQLTSDVVRVVEAMPPTNVQWSTQGGMLHHFKVMSVQIPQLRSNYDSYSGVVHASEA